MWRPLSMSLAVAAGLAGIAEVTAQVTSVSTISPTRPKAPTTVVINVVRVTGTNVHWTIFNDALVRPAYGSLGLYWIPATVEEFKGSGLLASAALQERARKGVNTWAADPASETAKQLQAGNGGSHLILIEESGQILGRVDNPNAPVKGKDAVALIDAELAKREARYKQIFSEAKAAAKAGDNAKAFGLYKIISTEAWWFFPEITQKARFEIRRIGDAEFKKK